MDPSEASVAVLLGGRSGEREVSLQSGAAVLEALAGGVRSLQPVEILPDGRWQLDGRPLSVGAALEALAEIDLFFLALHGGDGEGGTLQGLLHAAGHRFTGSGVGPSALCMDKVFTRHLAAEAGLRVARGATITRAAWSADSTSLLAELGAWDAPGFALKPRHGGSSVGMLLVDSLPAVPASVERVLETGDEVLAEEIIQGIEATCGVLGNRGDELQALTPVEIEPSKDAFFTYEEKLSLIHI